MTLLLHIPPRDDAPIACDMSTATDTPNARLREYAALFADALVRRERTADAVVLAFRPDARARVLDLAQREAACCPFVDYRVELIGAEVIWTTSNPRAEHTEIDAMLDAFHALPDHDASGFFDRLAEQGVEVIEHQPAQFEFRQVLI